MSLAANPPRLHARLIAGAAAIAAAACLSPVGAVAAQSKAQDSFHNLNLAGYTVVSTAFVPGAEQSDKHPVVLVTLVKGKSVSVCTFALGAWENMGSSSDMDDQTRCDVRRY